MEKLSTRLAEDEVEAIRQAAAAQGMSTGAWLRGTAIAALENPPTPHTGGAAVTP